MQDAVTLLLPSAAGSDNVKVASVSGFRNGQKIIIDRGTNSETAVIAIIGTKGGTKISTATKIGDTVIPVASVAGFNVGQTITIDNDVNLETAVVASITAARGRDDRPGYIPTNSITVATPLTKAHTVDIQVSGTGITFASPLTKAHGIGAQIASNLPTPGEPNQY